MKSESDQSGPILDIHTHHPAPYPEGIVDCSAAAVDLNSDIDTIFFPDQSYSVGIHPWDTTEAPSPDLLQRVRVIAARPEVRAIGEGGIDLVKGGPLFRQLQVFKFQIELSETVGKPLIIHNVKATDIILGLHRDIKPTQRWIIHGFRQKPEAARALISAGCYLSFGEHFNPLTVRNIPTERILAETDAAEMNIQEIIRRLSEARGHDLTDIIAANSAQVLEIGQSVQNNIFSRK